MIHQIQICSTAHPRTPTRPPTVLENSDKTTALGAQRSMAENCWGHEDDWHIEGSEPSRLTPKDMAYWAVPATNRPARCLEDNDDDYDIFQSCELSPPSPQKGTRRDSATPHLIQGRQQGARANCPMGPPPPRTPASQVATSKPLDKRRGPTGLSGRPKALASAIKLSSGRLGKAMATPEGPVALARSGWCPQGTEQVMKDREARNKRATGSCKRSGLSEVS